MPYPYSAGQPMMGVQPMRAAFGGTMPGPPNMYARYPPRGHYSLDNKIDLHPAAQAASKKR